MSRSGYLQSGSLRISRPFHNPCLALSLVCETSAYLSPHIRHCLDSPLHRLRGRVREGAAPLANQRPRPLPSFPRRREPRSGATAPRSLPPSSTPYFRRLWCGPTGWHEGFPRRRERVPHVAIVTFARCANGSSLPILPPMPQPPHTLHASMPPPAHVGKCRILSESVECMSRSDALLSQNVARCRARNPLPRSKCHGKTGEMRQF